MSSVDSVLRQPFPPKTLFTVDALVDECPGASATLEAAERAVAAGAGTVMDTSMVVFPNGAATVVLVLAESHLSIHTWPEERLVMVDLFSCGQIDGDKVMAELRERLALQQVREHRISRGVET